MTGRFTLAVAMNSSLAVSEPVAPGESASEIRDGVPAFTPAVHGLPARYYVTPRPRLQDPTLEGWSARIMTAPFSAIIMVGALVLPEVIVGITEASTTRRRSMPKRRNRSSTTAVGSL